MIDVMEEGFKINVDSDLYLNIDLAVLSMVEPIDLLLVLFYPS